MKDFDEAVFGEDLNLQSEMCFHHHTDLTITRLAEFIRTTSQLLLKRDDDSCEFISVSNGQQ